MSSSRRIPPDRNLLDAKSRAEVRRLLRRIAPVVRSRFRAQATPTPAELRLLLDEASIDASALRWACALFCSPADFDEERHVVPELGDYRAMRAQIGLYFFAGEEEFDSLDPKAIKEAGTSKQRERSATDKWAEDMRFDAT